jgi:hypothetical protein
MIEDQARLRELRKRKNLQSPQNENEGIQGITPRARGATGLILLFDGEAGHSLGKAETSTIKPVS